MPCWCQRLEVWSMKKYAEEHLWTQSMLYLEAATKWKPRLKHTRVHQIGQQNIRKKVLVESSQSYFLNMKREHHRDVVERKIRITDVKPTNLQQLLMWSYCNIPDPKQFSDKNWREFELLLQHLCLNTTTYFKHVLCPKLASVIVMRKYIWLPLCLSSNLLPKQGGKNRCYWI